MKRKTKFPKLSIGKVMTLQKTSVRNVIQCNDFALVIVIYYE